ncbi:MAG: hypothetical protein LBR23_06615, partial [Spirochaetaceae bacterium]|nr:hypothetical protein [Spirochaetaceae bacterium]
KAESCYRAGLYYWEEAKKWSEKANVGRFRFLFLTGIQAWEDESARIGSGRLDYEKMLTRELSRLEKVIQDFSAMTADTY